MPHPRPDEPETQSQASDVNDAERARPQAWGFLAWAIIGSGSSLALLTGFTIGIFVAPLVALATMLLVWRGGGKRGHSGLLTGAGAIPLYVSYLNRKGPGEVCHETPTGGGCSTEWSPWPWFAVGLLLVTAGIGLFLWLPRERRLRAGSSDEKFERS